MLRKVQTTVLDNRAICLSQQSEIMKRKSPPVASQVSPELVQVSFCFERDSRPTRQQAETVKLQTQFDFIVRA